MAVTASILTSIFGSPPNEKIVEALNNSDYCKKLEMNDTQKMACFLGQVGVETDGLSSIKDEYSPNFTPGGFQRTFVSAFKTIPQEQSIRDSCTWGRTIANKNDLKNKKNQAQFDKDTNFCFDSHTFNPDNSKAIFDFIYGFKGNTLGNKSGTDDGYYFRGRGLIQLTGRTNYTDFTQFYREKEFNVPGYGYNYDFTQYPNPNTTPPVIGADAISKDPIIATLSAMWFFSTKAWNNNIRYLFPKEFGRNHVSLIPPDIFKKITHKVNTGNLGIDERWEYYLDALDNLNLGINLNLSSHPYWGSWDNVKNLTYETFIKNERQIQEMKNESRF